MAISVRSLGKSYKIQHQATSNDRLKRSADRRFSWSWQDASRRQQFSVETFWALQDVSFDVPRGRVFGVIGRNGAGKSTLLKILSRITDPTTGHAEIHGRVGSLLEVGTGFHPELSGRENIYLNGTLLGMRRREINAVFDDIVEFAEVAKFIDTPVKRYSSGMYVRLAFAVAAHLQPEVLIIDEVLAVGDISFQKKCLGKMKDVTSEGRTVLFVSHSLSTVNSICDECLLLEGGQAKLIGPTSDITKAYFETGLEALGPSLDLSSNPIGNDVSRLHSAKLINSAGSQISHAHIDCRFGIKIVYEIGVSGKTIVPNIHFFRDGTCAFMTWPRSLPTSQMGLHTAIAWIPPYLMNEGQYIVHFGLSSWDPVEVHSDVRDRFMFNVIEDISDEARHGFVQKLPGAVRPKLDWSIH